MQVWRCTHRSSVVPVIVIVAAANAPRPIREQVSGKSLLVISARRARSLQLGKLQPHVCPAPTHIFIEHAGRRCSCVLPLMGYYVLRHLLAKLLHVILIDLLRAYWRRKCYWIPTKICNSGRLHNHYCNWIFFEAQAPCCTLDPESQGYNHSCLFAEPAIMGQRMMFIFLREREKLLNINFIKRNKKHEIRKTSRLHLESTPRHLGG